MVAGSMFDDLFEEDDELEGSAHALSFRPEFHPPRESSVCWGHDSVESLCLEWVKDGSLPHGLIFYGSEGIGKATFAFRFVRYLLKYGTAGMNAEEDQDSLFGGTESLAQDFPQNFPDELSVPEEDPVFSKVASGGHPDLITVERAFDAAKGQYKGLVDVEEIRRIAPFLRMTSSDGGWRAVIIDDADRMNRNAQNALLKILEEPPKNTVIILITHRVGALIPTIRSRTRAIAFQSIEEERLITIMKEYYPDEDPAALRNIAMLSEGSLGRAIFYLEENGIETIQEFGRLLAAWPRWDWPAIHGFAEVIGRSGQDSGYKAFHAITIWLLETLCFYKAKSKETDINLPPALQNEGTQKILHHYSLEGLLTICDNIKAHLSQVDRGNLDKRHGVFGVFAALETKQQ